MDWTIAVSALGVVGTFAGVGATIYGARRLQPANASEFTIEGLPWVREHLRGDFEEFLQLLLGLDYAALRGLTAESAGDSESKSKVFAKSPETWSLVVSQNGAIAGYWSFFSLSDRLVEKLQNGTLLDSEIVANEIHKINEDRVHNLYFEMFGIHPYFNQNRRKILKMLLESLDEIFQEILKNEVKIGGIYANGFTKEGALMCQDFGMRPFLKSAQKGDVYFLEDINVAANNLNRLASRHRFPGFAK